jgi:sec-independent protein translocase protein TatB
MFDIGWSELLLIGVVALIAIGPKELPGALRTLGQWMSKVRRMASEFQNQFHEAMREAELADLKKEVDEMASKAQSYAHFDPIDDIRRDIEKAASPPPELDTLTDTAALPPSSASTPSASTPSASTPSASTPSASTPPASTPPASAPAATETPSVAAPVEPAAPAEPATPQGTATVNTPDAGRAA